MLVSYLCTSNIYPFLKRPLHFRGLQQRTVIPSLTFAATLQCWYYFHPHGTEERSMAQRRGGISSRAPTVAGCRMPPPPPASKVSMSNPHSVNTYVPLHGHRGFVDAIKNLEIIQVGPVMSSQGSLWEGGRGWPSYRCRGCDDRRKRSR